MTSRLIYIARSGTRTSLLERSLGDGAGFWSLCGRGCSGAVGGVFPAADAASRSAPGMQVIQPD